MNIPDKERNGNGADKEMSLDVKDSPIPDAVSPSKQVVFQSKDKELVLYQKAGFTDKSRGSSNYTPSSGLKFEEFQLRFDDIPENKKTIDWVRKHPNFGITFIELPREIEVVRLPSISDMEKMPNQDLESLCVKHEAELVGGERKDQLIMALLKKVNKL